MNRLMRWVTNWGNTMNDDLKDIKGATVFYMEPDGDTAKEVYSDEACTESMGACIQPVDGELPQMYFKGGAASYCVLVQDATGTTVSRKEATEEQEPEAEVEEIELTTAEVPPVEELI